MSDIRIGVYGSQSTEADTLAEARLVEEHGLDAMWLGEVVGPATRLETSALCGAILGSTSRITVGVSVFNLSYWIPQSLARYSATLAWLFPGRFILGVGAGHTALFESQSPWGYPVRDDTARVAFFRESVEYLYRYFREPKLTFEGEHVRVDGATASPFAGDRRPPLLVGGSRPTFMRVAAQFADAWDGMGIWNYTPRTDEDYLAFFSRKLGDFRKMCADAGRDPGAVTASSTMFVALAPTQAEADEMVAEARRGVLSDGNAAFAGTPEGLVDFMIANYRAGARDFQLLSATSRLRNSRWSATDFIRVVGAEVAPAVRAAVHDVR